MEKITQLRKLFKNHDIDGYLIPKNNKFFNEYNSSEDDNLRYISNFSGSAGFAIILKNKNYIFVDGRYTIQAHKECGKYFKICCIPKEYPNNIFKKKFKIGFDPKLHTKDSLKRLFQRSYLQLVPIEENLIDCIWKRKKNLNLNLFYELKKKASGESSSSKISRYIKILKKKKIDCSFITASENVAWLLNIRGNDSKYSPLPISQALVDVKGGIKLFCNEKQLKKSLRKSLEKKLEIHDFLHLPNIILNLSKKKIQIDSLTCSLFYENLLTKNNFIKLKFDPIYYLKSLKNSTEINNTIKSHILDGAALTKFIFWIKDNFSNKRITELDAEKQLLKFRKKSKSFKFLSFPTISGSGPNSAIIHYRANKKSNRRLKAGDIYLIDSGGQYSYGTTDVTRTLSLNNKDEKIKDIFTRVLKGHIAVSNFKLNKNTSGKILDNAARKYLKNINLDYPHGTGHGVGYFLNVHEGPPSISKNNSSNFKKGMITSNEPGFYKKNYFGIRIENLIYVKKQKRELRFQNLTLAPIEKSLIEKKLLNSKEIYWLNNYHNSVFENLKKFMSKNEIVKLKEACSNI